MRRQSLILWTFFALFLATFSPIRAQESADENAGIMLTATDGVAFKSLEALARDYCGYASSSPSGFSLTYYELGLFDLPDPGVYDCWLFAYGFLSKVESNGTITAAGGKLGQLVVIRLANGSWATTSEIGTVNVASGYWPVYFRISDGDLQGVTFYGNENLAEMSYNDAWEFMESFRLFIAAAQDLPITDSVITSLYDFPRLRDFDIYDHDNGGVSDLIEWVRGGNVSNFVDDVPSPDSDCKCGACCVCRCECGLWAGNEECGLPDNCNCHQPDDPENPDDEECACANYCCACTCECEKCGDGEHSAHKNDNGECDGSFENCPDCHEEENPDDEECSCAKYCCYHTCKCKVCASAPAEKHSAHGNGSPTCNGTTGSAGCSCHTSTGDENDQVELPEEQDYEVPEEKRKDSFLSGSSFNEAFNRLKSEIARKFGLEKLSALFAGDLSGELPSWSFTLPYPLSGTVVLDLNELLDYSFVSVFRCVLVFWVYYFTAITVFNSLRRLL